MLCSFCQILNVILTVAYLIEESYIHISNLYYYSHTHGQGWAEPNGNIFSKIQEQGLV